jgi:hypothetical protein
LLCVVVHSGHIKDWVRQASHLDKYDADSPDEAHSPKHTQQSHFGRLRSEDVDGDVAVQLPGFGRSPAGKPKWAKYDDVHSDDDASMDKGVPPMPDRYSDNAGSDAAQSFVGSMADGMSDAGSEIETAVSAGAMGHEEELAVDTRYECMQQCLQ